MPACGCAATGFDRPLRARQMRNRFFAIVQILSAMLLVGAAPKDTDGTLSLYLQACDGARDTATVLLYDHGTTRRELDVVTQRTVPIRGRVPVTLSMPEGGYQLTIYDGACSAQIELGILAHQTRPVVVHMRKESAQSSGSTADNDMYAPAGDLAGTLPVLGVSVLLTGGGRAYAAVISGGAYSFDGVSKGKYFLQVRGSNFTERTSVFVPENFQLAQRNLSI